MAEPELIEVIVHGGRVRHLARPPQPSTQRHRRYWWAAASCATTSSGYRGWVRAADRYDQVMRQRCRRCHAAAGGPAGAPAGGPAGQAGGDR